MVSPSEFKISLNLAKILNHTCLPLVAVTNCVVSLLIVIIVSALVSVLLPRLDVSVFSTTPAFVFFSIFCGCVS